MVQYYTVVTKKLLVARTEYRNSLFNGSVFYLNHDKRTSHISIKKSPKNLIFLEEKDRNTKLYFKFIYSNLISIYLHSEDYPFQFGRRIPYINICSCLEDGRWKICSVWKMPVQSGIQTCFYRMIGIDATTRPL